MNKLLKTILITLISLFLFTESVFAVSENYFIIEPQPIFNVSNFIPGDSASEEVSITNNSGEDVGEIILTGEPNGDFSLAEAIDISIKKNNEIVVINLEDLLKGDELIFPSGEILDGEVKEFIFKAEYLFGKGNEHQNKTLNFNLFFNFSGKGQGDSDGGGNTQSVAVSGFGTREDPFRVFNHNITNLWEGGVTVNWSTNRPASGKVIYGPQSVPVAPFLEAPLYGYSYFETGEDNVTDHSVVLTGLDFGTNYYYRIISEADSFNMSAEHQFSTLGEVLGEEIERLPEHEERPIVPEIEGVTDEEDDEEDIEDVDEEDDEDDIIIQDEDLLEGDVGPVDSDTPIWIWILILFILLLLIKIIRDEVRLRKSRV